VSLRAESAEGRASRGPSTQQVWQASLNREKVVQATRELFAETGLLASMNEIATRAGVGKGTIYRAFPDRIALLSTVAIYQLEEVRAKAEDALAKDGDAGQIFATFVRFLLRYNVKNGLYLEVFRHQEVVAEVAKAQKVVRVLIEELYGRAVRSGSVGAPVSDRDLHFVLNAFVQWLNVPSPGDSPGLKQVERIVLNALGFEHT
jgi:AcrR family transcriptional regulator